MTGRRFEKWVYATFLLLMSTVIAFVPNLGLVYGSNTLVISQTSEKGIVIGSEFVVGTSTGAPGFSALKDAGFTMVGTIAYSKWGNREWSQAKIWINGAKRAGLKTFVDFWGDEEASLKMVTQAASTGADIIALDELISKEHFSQFQLLSVIKRGLSIDRNVSYIMNECGTTEINEAYSWTAGYPVQVATDSYSHMDTIDLGIQLAERDDRKPAAWLIFAKGSKDFPCYLNLDTWISYVKQRHIDTFFWFVDKDGTWQAQWQKVVAY